MSRFPKSKRIPGGSRSAYGTPVWHVYSETDIGFALGHVCRGADGKTWEAKCTHHVPGLRTKVAAENEVRRQHSAYWEARVNVIAFPRRRTRRPRPK
jgi:hypothetical protein